MLSSIKLTPKLVAIFLVFGLLPMAVVGGIAYQSAESVKAGIAAQFETAAVTIADKIDRNLAERYAEVQAFALNRAVSRRHDWYRPGQDNQIVEVMNRYVDTYNIYYLTLLVDLEGRLVAVNSRDADGQPIASESLYGRDYSDTEWFRALSRGEFTRRMPFTAPGNDVSDGTFIEDLHIDPDVTAIYTDDDGMTLGFSAPVYEEGKVIGYWSNRTRFALVEEIIQSGYQDLKQRGFGSAEVTLLDSEGRVIVDYDPSVHGGDTAIRHDFSVLQKLNLATLGVEPAQRAVAGETGSGLSYHARKKETQTSGFTHLKGALGYPGMNWSVLVRVLPHEATAGPRATQRMVLVAAGGAAALILLVGVLVGRAGTRPLKEMSEVVGRFAEGDLTARIDLRRNDEIGHLAGAFNAMAEQIVASQASLQDSLREAAVKAGVVENAAINIMVADRDFNITYVNPQSLKTLAEIEHVLPCKAGEVLGKNIDFFHRNPAHQRRILSDPANLPHQAEFDLGEHRLSLLASAVFDDKGEYVGPMITWEVITERVRLQREAQERTAQIERQSAAAERQRQRVLAVAREVLDASNAVASSAEEMSANARQSAEVGDRQSATVEGAAAAIQELAASSRSVAETTDDLARLVTENSAALTELAASIVSVTQNSEQMSQTVMSNSSAIEELAASIQTQADNAEQANSSAQEASQRAKEGADVVRQAIEGMSRIADRVQASSERIGELGKSSEQVSTIVAVINDIADQTNLLALNAAIEAARAGEQGRGFAVVADEVRKLAERTSQATREIDDMIGKIQGDTKDVVESMEEGMRDVEQGTQLASRSGEALEEIGRGVEQVNELMGQLSASSKEQATTSDQIVQATSEMNELVQQVAKAMAEQSQAVDVVSQSSEEMQTRVEQVSGAMREQLTAAEQAAGNMEEVNQLASQARSAAQEMDAATDQLARQAEDLKSLADSFESADAVKDIDADSAEPSGDDTPTPNGADHTGVEIDNDVAEHV